MKLLALFRPKDRNEYHIKVDVTNFAEGRHKRYTQQTCDVKIFLTNRYSDEGAIHLYSHTMFSFMNVYDLVKNFTQNQIDLDISCYGQIWWATQNFVADGIYQHVHLDREVLDNSRLIMEFSAS